MSGCAITLGGVVWLGDLRLVGCCVWKDCKVSRFVRVAPHHADIDLVYLARTRRRIFGWTSPAIPTRPNPPSTRTPRVLFMRPCTRFPVPLQSTRNVPLGTFSHLCQDATRPTTAPRPSCRIATDRPPTCPIRFHLRVPRAPSLSQTHFPSKTQQGCHIGPAMDRRRRRAHFGLGRAERSSHRGGPPESLGKTERVRDFWVARRSAAAADQLYAAAVEAREEGRLPFAVCPRCPGDAYDSAAWFDLCRRRDVRLLSSVGRGVF